MKTPFHFPLPPVFRDVGRGCFFTATRRKMLVGAFILEQLERNGIGAALLTCEGERFADWLTRPHDRALFGLLLPTSESQQSPAARTGPA